MSSLGDLLIRLRMDTAELESDSGRAAHVVERDMERMVARSTAAGQLIGDALSRIATGFGHMVTETLKAGDELSKLSQRSGFAVERLSELKFAGDLADVTMSQLATSLGFFNKALVDASNESTKAGQTFKALGVDIKAGPQEAFEQFIQQVNKLPDAELKVAAMRVAFGRAGDALIPLIGNLDETTEKARALGIVMSDGLAKDSERFNDAMRTLQAQSSALLLPTLTKAASGLATIAENFVSAAERGDKFKQVLIEIDKLLIATFGALVPGFDKLAEDQFKAYERMAASKDRGASGSWGDDRALPTPNADAVRAATSGQKDRPEAMARARDMTAERMRLAKIEADGEAELARETAEAWDAYTKIRVKQYDAEQAAATEKIHLEARAYLQTIENMRKFDESMRSASKETKDAEHAAAQFGLTMSSALGKVIRDSGSAGDAIKALAADIGQLITKLLILKPIEDSMTAAFKSSGGVSGIFGNLFGGGYTPKDSSQAASLLGGAADGNIEGALLGSFATGTDYVPRTGTYMLHEGEQVVRRGDNPGGGMTVYLDARGTDVGVVARIEQSMQQLGAQVRAMPQLIADRKQRGGSFSAAMR